ncbi:MAG: PEP-CTERM sorting domain-containing protein [Opitutaceae bacterium]
MLFTKHICAVATAFLISQSAHAVVSITITEVDDDVVLTGTGSINTTDLTSLGGSTEAGRAYGFFAYAITTDSTVKNIDGYTGVTGPGSIGSGISNSPTSGTGDIFGIIGDLGRIIVPGEYASGSLLDGSGTYAGTDLATMGLTEGIYTWTWGSGENADSMTVAISVPEPSNFAALAGVGMLTLVALRRRRVA